jgi:succinate dehydrogenase / fumarate reductase cytochrome b subunit
MLRRSLTRVDLAGNVSRRSGLDVPQYTPRGSLDVSANVPRLPGASLEGRSRTARSNALATRARKSKSDYAGLYKGHPGQYSWILHRITGVAVILFLFMHVVDTALIGWGPEAYNRVTSAYANPVIHLLELGLVISVLYHSLNGLKITLIDFFPRLVSHIKGISLATAAVFLLAAIPTTVIMLKQTYDLWKA